MGKTRTFIGIDIGDAIRASTAALIKDLSKTGAAAKWVAPESMHVTLLFLGEVDDRELHAVCKAVKEVAATEPQFALRVAGVGAFPTPRRPKILWAGITEGVEPLQRLYAALEERMLDLGCYRKEERGSTPTRTRSPPSFRSARAGTAGGSRSMRCWCLAANWTATVRCTR